jgi:hypothetical protein
MQMSDHMAPLRSRAGSTTRRRSSRGRCFWVAFDLVIRQCLAAHSSVMSKALLQNDFHP